MQDDLNGRGLYICNFSGSENPAFQRPAFQSSTDDDKYADKAVDGNYNSSDNECTLTEPEDAPWWIVELDQVHLVQKVVVKTSSKT